VLVFSVTLGEIGGNWGKLWEWLDFVVVMGCD
jgi:hypothetical protein